MADFEEDSVFTEGVRAFEATDPARFDVLNNTIKPLVDRTRYLHDNVGELEQFNADLANPDKGAVMVARSVVAVDSIADLLTLPEGQRKAGLRYLVKGYHAGSDVGGGVFYWDSTRSGDSDGGTVIYGWVRLNVDHVTPEMFGAMGDLSADDSEAVNLWWLSGSEHRLEASGRYAIHSGVTTNLTLPSGASLTVSAEGSVFDYRVGRAIPFRVSAGQGSSVSIVGMTIKGNDLISGGIYVSKIGEETAEEVSISSCKVYDVRALTAAYWSSSSVGIQCTCPAKVVSITDNVIGGVSREYVNPGNVSSVGISVIDVEGIVTIRGNTVEEITSPVGDADADGIVVFSKQRLNEGVFQDVNISIEGNTLRECKGRFIKLQTTGATVARNRFENRHVDMIFSFRGVESQFGAVTIENNYIHIGEGATGGGEGILFQIQVKKAGNEEIFSSIQNNDIRLDRDFREFCKVVVAGGSAHVQILNNFAYSDVEYKFAASIASMNFPDQTNLPNVGDIRLVMEGNTIPVNSSRAVLLNGEVFRDTPSVAEKYSLVIRNNKNNKKGNINSGGVVEVAGGIDDIPYLQNVTVYGNDLGDTTRSSRVRAKGMDVSKLPAGNLFYYNTDGTPSGGLLGTPSGFNRYVTVNRLSATSVELIVGTNGRVFSIDGETWYKYTPEPI